MRTSPTVKSGPMDASSTEIVNTALDGSSTLNDPSSANSSTLTPNNTVSQGIFPKIILQQIEQGHTSMDAHIETLLLNIKRPENLYALKYIIEYNGDDVSEEVLIAAMQSLFPKESFKVYTKETVIKLEWQLFTIMAILEQMCQRDYKFTCRFLDDIREAISIYKETNMKIMQLREELWKDNCAEFNEPEDNIKDFKCNYDNEYLLEIIENTVNSLHGDKTQQQTSINRAISILKALLVSVPGLAKIGIKAATGVEVLLVF